MVHNGRVRNTISTYGTCQSKVRVGAGEGEWFDTITGVRQGSSLFLPPFIMYIDLVIREVATTQAHHNYILAYADAIAQTAASEGELADIMNVWQAAFNKYHLQLNLLKTEVTMMGRSHQTLNIKIGEHTLKQMQSYKYLGSRPTLNEGASCVCSGSSTSATIASVNAQRNQQHHLSYDNAA